MTDRPWLRHKSIEEKGGIKTHVNSRISEHPMHFGYEHLTFFLYDCPKLKYTHVADLMRVHPKTIKDWKKRIELEKQADRAILREDDADKIVQRNINKNKEQI